MRKSNWIKLIKKFKGFISFKKKINKRIFNNKIKLKGNNNININNKKIIRKVKKSNGEIINKLYKGKRSKDVKTLRVLSVNIRKSILKKNRIFKRRIWKK